MGNHLFKFAEKDLEWNGSRWEYNGENEFVINNLRISDKKSGRARKKKIKFNQPQKPKYKHQFRKWKSYKQYCNSRQFRKWKNKVIKRDNHKCRFCGGKATTAHHIRYRTWGTEKVSDGIAVCNKCHYEKAHTDIKLDKELAAIMGDNDIWQGNKGRTICKINPLALMNSVRVNSFVNSS